MHSKYFPPQIECEKELTKREQWYNLFIQVMSLYFNFISSQTTKTEQALHICIHPMYFDVDIKSSLCWLGLVKWAKGKIYSQNGNKLNCNGTVELILVTKRLFSQN